MRKETGLTKMIFVIKRWCEMKDERKEKMEEIVEFVKKTKFERAIYVFRDTNGERCGGYELKGTRDEIIEQITELLKQMHREGWELYFRDKGRYEPYPTIYGDKKDTDVPYFKLVLK